MLPLPPPTTFAEGQRALFGWLVAAAGVFAGLCAIGMVATLSIIIFGGYAPGQERLVLIIFGCSLGGFIIAMITVIIALAVGGPVGRFSVKASKDGAELSAEGD